MGNGENIRFVSVLFRSGMDTLKYKNKLEKELKLVEEELNEVGRKNPENKVWEATEIEPDSDEADENEVADKMEGFSENSAIVSQLETQYNDIKLALEKINSGTYGKCEVGGEDIPEDRLWANPSAKTCIEHSK